MAGVLEEEVGIVTRGMKLKGQTFRIRVRYDNGGWKFFRVIERLDDRQLLVQDLQFDGLTPPNNLGPRIFQDDIGWPKLRKYWKHWPMPGSSSEATA